VDFTNSTSRLHVTPPLHDLVHETDIVQRGPAVGVCGRGLDEVRARLSDPFTGAPLLLLRQVAILGNDLDLRTFGCSDNTFDIAPEECILSVLESRDVHDHVDLFRAVIEDFLSLVLLHGGGFVAMGKPNNRADQHTGASQQIHRKADIVRLRRICELSHVVPRGVGSHN
jgi:hypothetical protein